MTIYNELDGLITARYATRGNFAKAWGVSQRTLSLKMNGKIAWNQTDMLEICELLGIGVEEIPFYFFNKKV